MQTLQRKIDKFCYNHPRFGIPNLMLCILVANVIVFFFDVFVNGYLSYMLSFNMERILHGEVWRIITFILMPSVQSSNVIFFAISTLFYYFIGSSLERHWGTPKFNLFVLFGWLMTVIVGLALGNTSFLVSGYSIPAISVSMYYVFLSMFFTIAMLYPDMTIMLFFIIPFKAKWVVWINAALFLYEIIRPLTTAYPLASLLPLVALLNYFLLFGGDLSQYISRGVKQTTQRARNHQKTVDFKSAQKHAREKKGYLHKCAVCGRTDVSNPELEFRYCSKCNGYYCYCGEHINSHVHVE